MDPNTVLRLAHEQAMQYPSVVIDYPFGPENAVYKVRGRMFMMAYELRGTPSLNLKIDPLDGEVLRDAYAEIAPGYHMNKLHWVTVSGLGTDEPRAGAAELLPGTGVPRTGAEDTDEPDSATAPVRLDPELLHDLVLESYCLVVAKLAKHDRPVDPRSFGGRGAMD